MYRYICVENRFGACVGVIHRENGTKPSVSASNPQSAKTSPNRLLPACTSRRALSLSASPTATGNPFLLANKIPLSSKHSLTPAILYAGPSACRS